jgi:single stranded DNA-binding protein (ssb)
MNRVTLVGRLGKDPEIRYTQAGKAVASFSIAVKRYKSEESDWIDIVAWGVLAESCGNALQKGSYVMVDGRIQNRSYEAQDGTKRRVTEVVASSVSLPLDAWEKQD